MADHSNLDKTLDFDLTMDFAAAWMLRKVQESLRDDAEYEVCRTLAGVYTPEGIETWLSRPNQAFGGRSALEAIQDGDGDRVVDRAKLIARQAINRSQS